jgi:hypothetical protein
MKICLCGSTRFKKEYLFWNALLTASGHVVYSVSMWSHGDRVDPSPQLKRKLDAVHMAKIANSDVIFVIDCDLQTRPRIVYTGDSTKREIEYAEILGKDVYVASMHGDEFLNACDFDEEIAAAMGVEL